jgi:acetyl-CoA acetyltransferase
VPDEIDGIIAYPGHVADDVFIENLNLPNVNFRATIQLGGVSAVSGLRLGALAVLGGAANHVLMYRAIKGSSGARKAARPSFLPGQKHRTHLEYVHGWNVPAQRYAVMAQRYRHEYGLDRAVLGEIALAARAHANLNPDAQMHERTLSMEQYLSGRLIADPYTLFDCSLETDGACAVIMSARPGPKPGVRIIAVAEAYGASVNDISNRDPFLSVGLDKAAKQIWNESGMGPEDMDAAMIYDCFTFEMLQQLEAAGFAKPGQGGDLVRDGGIRLGGKLPCNTHGGLLSEGHMGGLNHIVEAVRQLRGECGARQVKDARLIAVTGWGQLGDGSMAVLGDTNV